MTTESAINQRVLSEINKCKETIRHSNRSIERIRAKIITLRNTPASEWTENQINSVLPQSIQTNETAIRNAETRIENLKAGKLRREMVKLIEESRKHQEELAETQQNKKLRKQELQQKQRVIYDEWRDRERQSRREIGRGKGDLRRGERYYWNVVEDFSQKNMAKNLKSMPNNRGYRYRGINFYGELPVETNQDGSPKPVILTESVRGVQKIHEITKDSHKIFRKVNRNRGSRRVLESNTPRKRPGTVNLMDCVVSKRKQRR